MTGLFPGFLFPSSGLNRMSTSGGPGETATQTNRTLERSTVNGRPRPKSSPMSGVYDVRNSSTGLIVLNNKLARKPTGSRLCGQADITWRIVKPDPERHFRKNVSRDYPVHDGKNPSNDDITGRRHSYITNNFRQNQPGTSNWVDSEVSQELRDHVNSILDTITEDDIMRMYRRQWKGFYRNVLSQDAFRVYRTRMSSRQHRAVTSILADTRLSPGDRVYLGNIAEAYSVEDIRRGRQTQYNQRFWHAVTQGSYSLPDLVKYGQYLLKPNTKQQPSYTGAKHKRGKSAPAARQAGNSPTDGNGLRSNIDNGLLERAHKGRKSQTDVSSSHSKTTKDHDKMITQKGKEKARDLSSRPSSEKSLLSLMLEVAEEDNSCGIK
ncbi:unnamed protein product [Candidula unifasciata]|uniref:Uncharacterized protein n=1 Tax=Candidula unifasciata TaxID=100452 RepID=A0A8S3ZYS3_9EUPU|nr:unnamed protein product [Candidula unifasciata]